MLKADRDFYNKLYYHYKIFIWWYWYQWKISDPEFDEANLKIVICLGQVLNQREKNDIQSRL